MNDLLARPVLSLLGSTLPMDDADVSKVLASDTLSLVTYDTELTARPIRTETQVSLRASKLVLSRLVLTFSTFSCEEVHENIRKRRLQSSALPEGKVCKILRGIGRLCICFSHVYVGFGTCPATKMLCAHTTFQTA